MTLDQILESESRFSVDGYGGIAFYAAGAEVEHTIDDAGFEDWQRTGMVLMVMVGDDRKHSIDPDDVHEIADEDYCSGCGQIGCKAYG